MARYLVEVYVPNRGDALARTRAIARTLAHVRGVRYVRAILVPKDETCFHMLEAASTDAVAAATREASLAGERIAEAVEVSRRTLTAEP